MWVDKVNNMKETITPCVKVLNKKEQKPNETNQKKNDQKHVTLWHWFICQEMRMLC